MASRDTAAAHPGRRTRLRLNYESNTGGSTNTAVHVQCMRYHHNASPVPLPNQYSTCSIVTASHQSLIQVTREHNNA